MPATEVQPGLFHWTAFNENIKSDVHSHYFAPAKVAIDPKLPQEGRAVIPGDVEQIALTSGHHHRDVLRLARETRARIRGSAQAQTHVGDRFKIELFEDGEEFVPGVTAIHIGVLAPDEGALLIDAGHGALAVADAFRPEDGELAFMPDWLLGDDHEAVKDGLKKRYAELLDREFDTLLFAHGEPIVGGAKGKLREFTEG